jgi:hypothetical protein
MFDSERIDHAAGLHDRVPAFGCPLCIESRDRLARGRQEAAEQLHALCEELAEHVEENASSPKWLEDAASEIADKASALLEME